MNGVRCEIYGVDGEFAYELVDFEAFGGGLLLPSPLAKFITGPLPWHSLLFCRCKQPVSSHTLPGQ